MLAKKKETAVATAVPPKVTDLTEQQSSSKLPMQAESGIYVLNQMSSYRKTYKSSELCSEKILRKKTVCGGELLLKNAPLRRSFMYF